MIKNLVKISLIIFIVLVVAVLLASVFSNQPKKNISPIVQQGVTPTETPAAAASFAATQVAQHSAPNNCWVIVSAKVYNVTNLIPIHTGGPDKIIPFCGKDATTAFNTRNGLGPHPQRAQEALNTYYIGELSR